MLTSGSKLTKKECVKVQGRAQLEEEKDGPKEVP